MVPAELDQIMYVYVCNYLDMSTLDYVLVSTQMQWQNAMWSRRKFWLFSLSCRSAAVSFLVSGFRTPLSALSFVVCLCCVLNRYRAGHSFGVFLPSVSVCDLETSTNSHPTPHFGWTPQKVCNTNSTYRHSNCIRRLLPSPRQCGIFSRVDAFIGHISE